MPTDHMPAPAIPDSLPRPRVLESGTRDWVQGSMARVHAALVVRQSAPPTRAEWTALRASLAASRPLLPLGNFHRPPALFCH